MSFSTHILYSDFHNNFISFLNEKKLLSNYYIDAKDEGPRSNRLKPVFRLHDEYNTAFSLLWDLEQTEEKIKTLLSDNPGRAEKIKEIFKAITEFRFSEFNTPKYITPEEKKAKYLLENKKAIISKGYCLRKGYFKVWGSDESSAWKEDAWHYLYHIEINGVKEKFTIWQEYDGSLSDLYILTCFLQGDKRFLHV